MVNRWNSSGIFSQDSPHCSSSTKSKRSWPKWATHHNSKDELSSCRCSMISHGELKTMKRNVLLTPHLYLYLQKKISSRTLVIPRTWIRNKVVFHLRRRPQGEWDRVADFMMIKFGESGHPVFRATSPLSRGTLKSKEGGQLSIHFCADGDTIETVLRTIISVNQLSIYGAVSDLCEEYSSCRTWTGRHVLAEQSDPLFEPASLLTKTPTPSTEDPAEEDLLQKYQERVERLSKQNRVIKNCIDAGFLIAVEVGQYFMTKNTEEFSQSAEPVACPKYTLPRDDKSTDPKGWIQGNTKIGPVLEVTTSYCKVNMELKSESCPSTKTILTRGSEFLMDWTNWSQTWSTRSTSTTSSRPLKRRRNNLRLPAEPRLRQNREDSSSEKTFLPLLAHLQGLYLFVREDGLRLSQELNPIKRTQWQKDRTLFFGMDNYFEKKMVRSNSGDWKMFFGTNLSTLNVGLMICVRARWQEAEAKRKDFNTVLIRQDKKFFTFELFKAIQDPIPLILHYRTMYWFRTNSSSTFIVLDVQSIHTPSRIQDWYREDKILAGIDWRYSIQPWIPWIKNTKIQKSLIWPNHVLHVTSKSGKCTKIRCIGSIFSLLYGKDSSWMKQTRSNAVILYDTLPAYCISKVVVMESGEILYEKVYICHFDHHRRFQR